MEQSRFFIWVWRFNALVLALGAIFLIGMAGLSLLGRRNWEPAPEGHFAPVPRGAEKDHTYRLSPLDLGFGEEVLFGLGRWDGSPKSHGLLMTREVRLASESSRYNDPNTVNLLVVDGRTDTGHWLFHGYGRLVASEDIITKGAAPNTVAVALVIRTIDADTDKDGEMTYKDRQSFYVYRRGTGYATKLIDVDYVLSHEQVDDANFLLVYERGRTAYAATYSLPDFKLVSEKPLPEVPN